MRDICTGSVIVVVGQHLCSHYMSRFSLAGKQKYDNKYTIGHFIKNMNKNNVRCCVALYIIQKRIHNSFSFITMQYFIFVDFQMQNVYILCDTKYGRDSGWCMGNVSVSTEHEP